MAPHRTTLLEGDIPTHIRRLAMPLMFGMVATTAFNLADTWYLSRLGTSALACLGFTVPVVALFMGVIFGLSVGTGSMISRAYGEGDMERVRRLGTDSLVLSLLLATITAVLGYFFIDHLFLSMGAKADIMPTIHHYMTIWYAGMPLVALAIVGNSCIRATGDTAYPAAIMTLLAVLNIALDPLFIFGFKMGMPGAAAALVTSYIITTLTSLYLMIFRRRSLAWPPFHPDSVAQWKKVLHVGVPSILSNTIPPFSAAVIIAISVSFGREAVAALGIATRIESLAILPFYSLSAALSIFTGQNFGAGNYGRIREGLHACARYCLIWGAGITLLLFSLSDIIPHFFDATPKVAEHARLYFILVPISYAAMGIMVAANGALNAMGRPFPATFFTVLRAVGLYIPLALLGKMFFGFTGILLALTATNVIVCVISFLWNEKTAE